MSLPEGQIIGIIRGVAADEVCYIAEALLDSGVEHMEVSLSDLREGLACVRALAKGFGPELQLGVGTVTTVEHMDAALEAGAGFIITPAWSAPLARAAQAQNVTIYPGVFSPSDVMEALNMGLTDLKLFPAVALGPHYVSDLLGPFPSVKFIGVGGINPGNIPAFWEAGCRRFAPGSHLVPAGSTRNTAKDVAVRAVGYLDVLKRLMAQ